MKKGKSTRKAQVQESSDQIDRFIDSTPVAAKAASKTHSSPGLLMIDQAVRNGIEVMAERARRRV